MSAVELGLDRAESGDCVGELGVVPHEARVGALYDQIASHDTEG